MTTTPPEAPTGPTDGSPPDDDGPRVTRNEVRDLARLRRHGSDRKVAGVAGGLARHLDIDPIILRVAFVVLVFFGGAGLLIYGACWLLVPEDGAESAPIRLDERSRTVALLIVGVIAALALLGDSLGGWGFPWPLAIIALIVLLIMNRRSAPTPPPGPDAAPGTTYRSSAYRPGQVSPDPRRRGPLLFGFTLALIALGIGVLGIADLAGASVADSAYPALALGVTGAMLLLGAFYGRAGGLIAVGLVAALATAAATAAGEVEGSDVTQTPLTAVSVQDSYDVGAGEIQLDLTEVADLDALDQRTISLEARFGRIEVLVPDDVRVEADATVDAGGNIVLFGAEQGGFDLTRRAVQNGDPDAPTLTIDATLTFGEIVITNPGDPR